jgi:hypothetical protein
MSRGQSFVIVRVRAGHASGHLIHVERAGHHVTVYISSSRWIRIFDSCSLAIIIIRCPLQREIAYLLFPQGADPVFCEKALQLVSSVGLFVVR